MIVQIYLMIILILNVVMLIGGLVLLFSWKKIIKRIVGTIGKRMLSEKYGQNVAELIPGLGRIGIQTLIENSLRAARSEVLHRPLGSNKSFPSFEKIMFIPAQTSPFPIDKNVEVDISVTIGPMAKKPLKLDIPLMITGMGYGIGLSEKAKIALAKASAQVGTSINSGEGGFLQEERDAAKYYILQFGKTPWAKEDEELLQADAIEIKLGQGALAGMGSIIKPKELSGKARDVLRLEENEDAIIYETFFADQKLNDLKILVQELREKTAGVPIGAKMMAGGKLEEDLDRLISIGVDFITIDGAQAATHDAPPIIEDDFGIPTMHAVVRATKHLEKRKQKGKISLIVSGGFTTPGECLKALALGADAVALGTAILFAMSHDQSLKAVPWEPPTMVVWYDGKYADQFDIEKGAQAATNFLNSSTEEIKLAIRAMGKTALKDVTKADLVSYDEQVAKKIGIPFTIDSSSEEQTEKSLFKGSMS